MGGALSSCTFNNCAPLRAMAGDHPDVELGPSGFQMTARARQIQEAEREQRIINNVSKRESEVADMLAEIKTHNATVVSCNAIALKFKQGSPAWQHAMAQARAAFASIGALKLKINRKRVLISRGQKTLRQVRDAMSVAEDRQMLQDMNDHAGAVNLDIQEELADENEEQMSALADKADALDQVNERVQTSYEMAGDALADNMSFNIDGQDYALGVDSDLLAAMAAMAAAQERDDFVPVAMSMEPAQRPELIHMPEVPNSAPSLLTKRAGLAVTADGTVQSRLVDSKKKLNEDDIFSAVF